jgi:glycosyltransferase involved in cell wall biosynthesis
VSADPKAPRIAVLVACHDDGSTIGATIDSLRNEERTELVVVDDGSTAESTLGVLVALEADGVRVIHQENAGPASAWMRGLAATSAAYVMPFSSDDILVPGATGLLADALDADPRAAAAWGDLESFGAAAAYVPSVPALCPWHVTYMSPAPGIALFRRELLLDAGGWQLRRGMEDWDLWMRLAAHGHPVVHVPERTFRYRRDAGGRFRGRVAGFEGFYEQLRERNADLFASRRSNLRTSPAPHALRVVLPLIDRLPFVPRLLKVQLCELATLLLWNAGLRRTIPIVAQGLVFRARLLMSR